MLFLFTSGCLYRAEKDLSGNLRTSFIEPLDMDADGAPEAYYLLFSPARVEASNTKFSISRSLYIYPDEITIQARKDIVDAQTLSFLKAKLANLEQDITKADASCKAKVTFSICNDELSCEAACTSKLECSDKKLGPLLLDYRKLLDKREELMKSTSFILASMKEGDSLAELSKSLSRLEVNIETMKNHPLIREVSFCDFNVDFGELSQYSGIVSPKTSRALVLTSFETQASGDSAIEVKLSETIDPAIDKNINSFELHSGIARISSKPTELSYQPIKLTGDMSTYLEYIALGKLSRATTPYEVWNQLNMDVKIVTVKLDFLDNFLSSLNSTVFLPIAKATTYTKLSFG
ncbi:MAG: hypothetical protein D6797_08680, partial [Bdellovibrio sp.]